MKRVYIALGGIVALCALTSMYCGAAAQTLPDHEEVCAVYVNTGDVVVPPRVTVQGVGEEPVDDETRYDAQSEVYVPIPPGATGIDSWQLGVEMQPGQKVRTLVFLRSGGPFTHYATREAGQSHFIRPGVPVELAPGALLKMRVRFFNETTEPQLARGNAWVYFRMSHTY
jgi:hypothetical protein